MFFVSAWLPYKLVENVNFSDKRLVDAYVSVL